LSAAHSRPSLEGKSVVIADDDPIIAEYLELRCRQSACAWKLLMTD
jgi:hypothetical protein